MSFPTCKFQEVFEKQSVSNQIAIIFAVPMRPNFTEKFVWKVLPLLWITEDSNPRPLLYMLAAFEPYLLDANEINRSCQMHGQMLNMSRMMNYTCKQIVAMFACIISMHIHMYMVWISKQGTQFYTLFTNFISAFLV